MRGIYNQPYLDLDEMLPLDLLDATEIEMELATAPRTNNVWGTQFRRDFSNFMSPPEDASQRVRDFYAAHAGEFQVLQNFAKLHYGVYSPTWSVRVSEMERESMADVTRSFQSKVDDPSLWTRIPDIFPSVNRFIDECGAFSGTGRINFFITDHLCHTPLHNDYAHPYSNGRVGYNAPAEKEFLWISLRDKNFYVWDDATETKHEVTSRSAWFNTLDLHGGDPAPVQSWSLRIDGRFSSEFRQRLDERFSKLPRGL